MNRFRRLLTFVLLLVSAQGTAQGVLSGNLVDAVTKEPVIGALVRVDGSFTATISDLHGGFRFSQLPAATVALTVTHLSYNDLHVTATVPKENLQLLLEPRTILSDEVTVTATRADNKSAMTYTSVTKEDLQSLNLGQDLPILLNYLPSVVTTSDAGAGVGYTGIRIRGSDATRVNVTINGVPVNDAESHQVYWVDLPDIASSVDNLQVQRGIGTSTNGAGAFGGSINIRSDATSPEAYGEINSSYGSFNTWKNTLRFGTGLLQGKFGLEGRLSRITSEASSSGPAATCVPTTSAAAILEKTSRFASYCSPGKSRPIRPGTEYRKIHWQPTGNSIRPDSTWDKTDKPVTTTIRPTTTSRIITRPFTIVHWVNTGH